MPKRIYFFYGLLLIGWLLILGRLFELQVIYGAKNRSLAEGNRIRKVVLPAPRGLIYDRQGKELVVNVPVYRLCSEKEKNCQPITRDEALKREAQGNISGELRVAIGRQYPYGQTLAHLLGYLGEASVEEVEKKQAQLGDLLGRMGVEQEYETVLRGQPGGEVFEVNAQEEKIRELGATQPKTGQDLKLSIDAELSKIAFEALSGRSGAVVATDAKTGQVLVLVSSPSFNPEKISPEVLTDPNQPLFNRALAGLYPPGSTFKIVTAAAGLEEGKIDRETTYEDTGQIKVGDYIYNNWYFTQYGRTEGMIGLVQALKRSTDTFFYKVGEWVGPTKLSEWGKAFGLGEVTGLDLPSEAAGLVPSPEWKEKTLGERWFLGNTYHFAIGQENLLTTPLQINMMMSVIANNGRLCPPRVLQDTESKSQCQDLQLNPETLVLIKEGLKEACSSGGTAFPFFDFEPRVAGKTGTAEFGDKENRTHAWFTAFAPVDPPGAGPQIVVTALVEAGGEGSYVAAPIVKKVIEAWFREVKF